MSSFPEISLSLSPIKQLKQALVQNSVIAERKDKPNLSVAAVQALARLLPDDGTRGIILKWETTKLDKTHDYYDRADTQLFQILFCRKVPQVNWFYLKGFFFNKEKLIGVYLISARKVDASFKL